MTAPVYYLSGPVSSPDPAQLDRNKQAFRDAAKALRARGLTVVSPVELCPEDGKPWEWYMRRCIAELVKCDEVVLLPGYVHSRGARVEWDLADDLGMRCRALSVILAYEDSAAAVREVVAKRAAQ